MNSTPSRPDPSSPERGRGSPRVDRNDAAHAQERATLEKSIERHHLRADAIDPTSDSTNAATALIIVAAVVLALIFLALYWAMR
jgi:cobalamin biosynthesis Mg chelatase CobN